MSAQPTLREVFYSYAHEDEMLRDEIEKHLKLLQRQGLITSWYDQQIFAGTDWAKDINTHLETASLILLLVSSDFLASDYCYSTEMKRALERHKANEAQVIPILLRPVAWKGAPFEHLQVLPTDARPVTEWENRDAAFRDIAIGIERVIKGLPLLPASLSPSALPSIWNIPYLRNVFFAGREHLLKQLANALKSGQPIALSQPQVISGLGGIGKTQIAVEYAYHYAHDYQFVFWTLADSRESLVLGYITIAGLLNLPEKDAQKQEVAIHAVKTWLQTHGSWLLILDNADDLSLAYEFLPAMGGHLLITTRAQVIGTQAQRIEVDVLPREVGALFLLHRSRLFAQSVLLVDMDEASQAVACEICNELGDLPLALDQAGAFIEETQCSLQDYQRRYRTRRAQLLGRRGGPTHNHPEPVATTWSLSFEKVEKKSPIAADLLRVCAFLHPDAIPVELIIKGADHLGPLLAKVSENDLVLDEAIATLLTYSLIRRNVSDQVLSIHRLVQAVLKDTMDEEARKQWAERAMLTVNEVFPEVEFETWAQCERYLPHALMCAELVEQGQISSQEIAHLLNKAGSYLIERARHSEAQPLLECAYQMSQQERESEHLDTARDADALAYVYEKQSKYEDAQPLYERALSIREQQLGANHPDTATSLDNLALLYQAQGKYEQAEPLQQRALEICEQQLGANHPDTATSLDNLALLYRAQGKYEQAEPLQQRALEICEQQLGANHPDTATSLNDLAGIYSNQGKYEEAGLLFQRAHSIYKQALGEAHPHTATTVWWLAFVYEQQHQYEKAEPLYRRAFSVFERMLGKTHPRTQNMQSQYVSLLRKMDRDKEAIALETTGQLPSEEH